ncbi:MAG: 3-oxoacyl-[acyl-carrier-protein] reductase [Janthinobacterium lividum]
MFSLQGKKALITGASGGIGSAIATLLHQQGAEITISGTRLEALENIASTLGDRCHILTCNLSDNQAVETLVPQAEKLMGSLDILVNNAGMTRDNLLLRMKEEDFDTVLQINLKSAFLLMRSAIKGMMKQRQGRIINISSIVGVTGNPGQTNYCASKAGLIGMTKSLAQEIASRGITVNCLAPGFIESSMTDILTPEQRQKINQSIPLGRIGLPQEIAAGVAYLASDEAAYITGQTLHINGGMAMI